ncbi:MAG TPA: NADH-quinone oxidoreductase subunit NuoG [Solirubrobacterales bacterium]|nr:NADH-quinone oxidoreductase subunit NuoG [Solirubrobacterales bacterium]
MNAEQITLVVDGVEVQAPQGMMLVDAAKHGDVEIPVFCYEPKLGQPVGACRMCLVEIEGIPKLQTACSTPVRDGMVVYTQTDRVKEAQNAVVEFLLVNHPLDCPVCDKGGECPLQDISMGWGPGKSRMIDPKRHFQKPIPLSPLIKIDRERCILCYRCVRFSQEVAEDEQLQLLERGASSFVGTFDDRPYIAPFHGNIIELCPVGALTSDAYRFRARPWDIEDAGTVCTLCPSQCNIKLTVRDERIQRVLARDNAEVDDGWLCDKGRFGYQMIESPERITEPMIRQGGELISVTWDQALEAAAAGLRQAGDRTAAILGGSSSNEEGYLVQRIVRQALGSPHVTSTLAEQAKRGLLAELSRPELAASMSDIDRAKSILVLGTDPLHSMPILDLRIRKVVRRKGTRLAIATDRPTALDGGAEEVARYTPGQATEFIDALAAEVGVEACERGRDELGADAERIAGVMRPGSTVIVWAGQPGHTLVETVRKLDAKLMEVPAGANARGLREVGCQPVAGPGLSEVSEGRDATGIRDALAVGELDAVFLANADPVRDGSNGPAWTEALGKAKFVLAISMFEDASTKHADVIFPAESYAEKEGTVTHPDGRLQRVRPSVPNPDRARPTWEVLVELSALLGEETGIDSAPEALAAIASDVPFYAGITEDEIGGRGVRWQEREAAGDFPALASSDVPTSHVGASGERVAGAPRPSAVDGLQVGTYKDLWAAEVTERSPALRFLLPKQTLELAPADADRLGIAGGQEVDVRSNGTSVRARVAIRERVKPGSGFLIEGLGDVAGALAGRQVEISLAEAGE